MRTVFNEDGEPIGTERDPDPDELYDMYNDEMEMKPDPDGIDDCYYCGKTRNCDAMIYHEIKVAGVIKEVAACYNCEHEMPYL